MHSRIERIRTSGFHRQEHGRNEIFDVENPEPLSYRLGTTEIFTKANEEALDHIKIIKPFARARSRKTV